MQAIAEDVASKIFLAVTSATGALIKGGSRFSNMSIDFAAEITTDGTLRFEHCFVKMRGLNAGALTNTRLIMLLDGVLWLNSYTGSLTNNIYLSDSVGHFADPITPHVICKAASYVSDEQRRLVADLSSNPMCLEGARHICIIEENGQFWEWRGSPLPAISQASTQRFACGDESISVTLTQSNNVWTITAPNTITPYQYWWQ